MTCIVGLVEDNKLYLGGDSAGVAGYHVQLRKDTKVFRKEDMLFGFTSSFRMGQLIRFSFNIPEQSARITDYEYMCTTFIDELIRCFKEKGYASVENSVVAGGSFLVGFNGTLYSIESDFQVGMFHRPFAACGCGEEYALGVMHALEDLDMNPKEKINRALKAASECSAGVSPPFTIMSMSV